MVRSVLDNPIWHSLTTRHAKLAIGSGSVRRYPATVTPFAAVRDTESSTEEELKALVSVGERVGVLAVVPQWSQEWSIVHSFMIRQYVWQGGDLPASPSVVGLDDSDIGAMTALTELVYPAYFRHETARLGRYFGIKRGDVLCAMGGIRMAMDGYQEISAVCTHPDFRGQGNATVVTAHLVRHVTGQGDVPFLHTEADNVVAQAVYEKLGFRLNQELPFSVVERV